MWIFGYGSLIWKADFEFEERRPCFIRGYVRRFWQGSNDHRGTVEAPGRVVTLISSSEYSKLSKDSVSDIEEHIVWGVAYRIAQDKVEEVSDHLDFREKNGYEIVTVDIFDMAGTLITTDCRTYIAKSSNDSFLGPRDISEMARHIVHSVGPSGANWEYASNLRDAHLELFKGKEDRHLHDLCRCIGELLAELSKKSIDWKRAHDRYFPPTTK